MTRIEIENSCPGISAEMGQHWTSIYANNCSTCSVREGDLSSHRSIKMARHCRVNIFKKLLANFCLSRVCKDGPRQDICFSTANYNNIMTL